MKAIVRDIYGSADVLELGDIDKPEERDDIRSLGPPHPLAEPPGHARTT